MPIHKLTDVSIYLGGYAVAADHSRIAVAREVEALDVTAFGTTTREHAGGLDALSLSGDAFVQYGAGQIDEVLRAHVGAAMVFAVAPVGAVAGDLAYFGRGLLTAAPPVGGAVGEIHRTSWTASGAQAPVVRGQVFRAAGATSSSGNSAVVQLGAVAAGAKLWAGLHVLSVSGGAPTLNVAVKSAVAGGFGAPTTRITFAEQTAIGAALGSVAGEVTDQYWRVDWTIGGGGTFSFVVVVGIA